LFAFALTLSGGGLLAQPEPPVTNVTLTNQHIDVFIQRANAKSLEAALEIYQKSGSPKNQGEPLRSKITRYLAIQLETSLSAAKKKGRTGQFALKQSQAELALLKSGDKELVTAFKRLIGE
jgi:hypothetical protein